MAGAQLRKRAYCRGRPVGGRVVIGEEHGMIAPGGKGGKLDRHEGGEVADVAKALPHSHRWRRSLNSTTFDPWGSTEEQC